MATFNIIRREFQYIKNVPDDIFNSLNKCKLFYGQNGTKVVQQSIRNFFNKKSKNVNKLSV